jgi:hypothetical protein
VLVANEVGSGAEVLVGEGAAVALPGGLAVGVWKVTCIGEGKGAHAAVIRRSATTITAAEPNIVEGLLSAIACIASS